MKVKRPTRKPPRKTKEEAFVETVSAFTKILREEFWRTVVPEEFSTPYAARTGGYPKGAVVTRKGKPGRYWVSRINRNINDPDRSGEGWDLLTRVTFTGDDDD